MVVSTLSLSQLSVTDDTRNEGREREELSAQGVLEVRQGHKTRILFRMQLFPSFENGSMIFGNVFLRKDFQGN